MRTLLIGMGLAMMVLMPSAAEAHHPARNPGRHLLAGMAHAPMPTPMPTIIRGQCPGIGESDMTEGCYDDETNTVYVMRSADHFGLEHEIGHAFDATAMDAVERQDFANLLGYPRRAWEPTEVTPDGYLVTSDDALAELFADAYAACRLRMLPMIGHTWELIYNYMPSPQRHVQVCNLIARAASTPGTPVDAAGWR